MRYWWLPLVLLCGCAKGPVTGSVSGVVRLDGKPLTAGAIAFIADDGKTYQSDIQSDGQYRVDGVPLGEAIVLIHPPPVDDAARHMAIKESKGAPLPPPAVVVPKRYSDTATSDLRCQVKAGHNPYDAEMRR